MKNINNIILALLLITLTISCTKEPEFFSEPYSDAAPNIGITIDRSQFPTPSIGAPGIEVTMKVTGLEQYKDKAKFQFNGQRAEIISITNSEVKVKVPLFASTGPTSIIVDDVIVFGPLFTVEGVVRIDPTWVAHIGTNGSVINRWVNQDGRVIYVGGFTNYNNKGLVRRNNRLVRTYSNGNFDGTWRTGEGANGELHSVVQIGNRYYIGGGFRGYGEKRENISNLTSLNLNGEIDTLGVHPWRRPDQADTIKYVPFFNGGFNTTVTNLFESDGKLLVGGHDIRYYVSRDYLQSNYRETRDTTILDSVEIRHLARLNLDGSIDKTFRFDGSGKAFAGGNGRATIFKHNTGPLKDKIIVYGSFTTFDGVSAGRITRLNADGTIDNTFNPGGAGADFNIYRVTYNETTNKYMVVGEFNNFNGTPIQQICRLNANGTLDNTFTPKVFTGGQPTFAQQLSDGNIVISGLFYAYDNVTRGRFMIVDSSGNLIPELNTTGEFQGSLNQVIETESEDGKRALLLLGSFRMFDSEPADNITRIILE